MKTAIILHGMPPKEEYFDEQSRAPSQNHWLSWTQRQLLLKGILAQNIELPLPFEPDYNKWRSIFEQLRVDEDTDLIGHSCGGGFLVRWLSEHKIKVGKVALIAPWLDPNRELKTGFFDFEIDKDLVGRTKGTALFISKDDKKEILVSSEMLQAKLPLLQIKEFANKGHFTFGDMKTEQFPELLEYILL